MNNKLTEERLLDLIDGSELVMGGGRDRDSDRGRDGDRSTRNIVDSEGLDELEPIGEASDLYGDIVFDE